MFIKLFVKQVFLLVEPFLANLHSTSSKNIHIPYALNDPKQFYLIFQISNMSIKNMQNCTMISKPWKQLEKVHPEKVICQNFLCEPFFC
jgi:hypothetical protein